MPGILDDVERALLFRCPALLYEWLPGGLQQGAYYKCANLNGGHGDSLVVNLSGSKAGKWGDWAGGSDEHGGNLVSLYAKIKSLEWKDALFQLAKEYGIEQPKQPKKGNEWVVITPVPESAFPCAPDGSPLLPDSPLVNGASRFWPYFDREGALLCFRVRWDKPGGGKEVKPLTWARNKSTGAEEWQLHDLPEPRPLYNLPALTLGPSKVLIVEGEKAADAAQRLLPDWWVTTWPGGSKAVARADWSPIRRLETPRLLLWPDKDEPGIRAMTEVGEFLGMPHEVVRLDPAWPEKFDLADAEEMGWDTARVEKWIESNSIPVEPEPPRVRPEVDLTGKNSFRHMHDLYGAMREIKAHIYDYNSGAVYVKRNLYGLQVVESMEGKQFRSWATENLATFHYNGNGKCPCRVSEDLANDVIFNREGNIPSLKRFADLPIFAPSGQLLDMPGYHEDSHVFLSIPKDYDPDMPITQAWEHVDDLLKDFPFESESDKTCAVAFVLTAILRDLMAGPTPLFRFEAPSPGTGKSLLCRGLCEIITPQPGACGISESSEEVRKAVTTSLLYNPAVVMFDNVEKIDSPDLMRAFSEYIWKERLLGQNRDLVVPIRTLWCATLNNPILTAEAFRRSVRIRLNAKVENPCERPETSFRHHPFVSWVRANRGKLISAFVAIAKNGVGQDIGKKPALGSYESWVDAVAPVLELNSYPDFLKNIEHDRRSSLDSRSESIREFVEEWAEKFGTREVTVSMLADIATHIDGMPIRRTKDGKIGPSSLGFFLKKHRDMVIGKATIGEVHHTREGSVCRLTGDIPAAGSSEEPQNRLPYSDTDQF